MTTPPKPLPPLHFVKEMMRLLNEHGDLNLMEIDKHLDDFSIVKASAFMRDEGWAEYADDVTPRVLSKFRLTPAGRAALAEMEDEG